MGRERGVLEKNNKTEYNRFKYRGEINGFKPTGKRDIKNSRKTWR